MADVPTPEILLEELLALCERGIGVANPAAQPNLFGLKCVRARVAQQDRGGERNQSSSEAVVRLSLRDVLHEQAKYLESDLKGDAHDGARAFLGTLPGSGRTSAQRLDRGGKELGGVSRRTAYRRRQALMAELADLIYRRELAVMGGSDPLPNRGGRTLYEGDASRFIADLAIADGSEVEVGEEVVKGWRLQNVGNVPWTRRLLERQGPHDDAGRLRSERHAEVPETQAGETCDVYLTVIAPDRPGAFEARWKMVDADSGAHCFPDYEPVYMSVDAVLHKGHRS
ncbi:MAG: NBR1-Ig-like domain-containing protein [Actinomycetota bacterium]|nr:NBR1-Ig-like domain-containing protein [Actinomycetota bacterium]